MRGVTRFGFMAPVCLALAVSTPALADDPRDLAMRSADERARDKAEIRRLNQEQAAFVRERDARLARENAESRSYGSGRRGDVGMAQRDYAEQRRAYDRAMADWRNDVAACRAGYYEHCRR